MSYRFSIVIATKYTTNFRTGHGSKEIMANSSGTGTKSLHTSVTTSLQKLKTDYVDIVSIHRTDEGADIKGTIIALC